MLFFLINIFLAVIWMALTGDFSPANFLAGFGIGFATLFISQRNQGARGYLKKFVDIIKFSWFFLEAVVWANLEVAWEVITPELHMTPAFVPINVKGMTSLQITLLANIITLTPGTLTVDVSPNREQLLIHAMYSESIDSMEGKDDDKPVERKIEEIKNDIENRFIPHVKELL